MPASAACPSQNAASSDHRSSACRCVRRSSARRYRSQLQRALRRLAALPTDAPSPPARRPRCRGSSAAPSRRISRITLRMSAGVTRVEPFVALAPVLSHRRQEEAKVLRRHIGQRVGPVFEHAFVDALRLPQIGAAVAGDPAIENMVVAALDHIDGVDLHIAEMRDRGRRRRRARRRTAPACPAAAPAARYGGPRSGLGKRVWSRGASRRQCSGIRVR